MALKISTSDPVTQRSLAVADDGVEFCETALLGGKRRFRFEEIDSVLLSPKGLLSFQVGREIFSIPVRRGDRKDEEVIEALVRALKGGG